MLHARNTPEPDRVYDYFRRLGVTHLQFLPLAGNALAAPPDAVGAFLCRVFDRWMREDVGRVVIQAIDEALRPIYGIPHALCIHRETCGDVAVLEHDGGFYACDHFVNEEHLLGNLRERTLSDLCADPRLLRFGQAKRDTLPSACRQCDVLSSCNGGCPKDRSVVSADEAGMMLCVPRTRHSSATAGPVLERLAAHMKQGRTLRSFAGSPPDRQSLIPGGEGSRSS